jgi:hypothetical protein
VKEGRDKISDRGKVLEICNTERRRYEEPLEARQKISLAG